MHALIVDDSRTGRTILCRILEGAGFVVEEARNGAVALERLCELPRPDVVMIDWNMPVLTGIELVEAVRRHPENDGVRLMMVTTERDLDRISRAIRAGADEYVVKPYTSEVILEKLRLLGLDVEVDEGYGDWNSS